MNEKLIALLAQAVVEIQEHNRDYHYSTARMLLAEMREAVELQAPGFDWKAIKPKGRWDK